MTVRIEKPQFNLRDKISSLDYIKLPKNKMPEGTTATDLVLTVVKMTPGGW